MRGYESFVGYDLLRMRIGIMHYQHMRGCCHTPATFCFWFGLSQCLIILRSLAVSTPEFGNGGVFVLHGKQ